MTGDLQAFADLIRADRQKNPFILSGVWHIRTDSGNGILCGTWGLCWTAGDMDSVTASGIPVCLSCQRMTTTGEPTRNVCPNCDRSDQART